jgi:hypothetical protein
MGFMDKFGGELISGGFSMLGGAMGGKGASDSGKALADANTYASNLQLTGQREQMAALKEGTDKSLGIYGDYMNRQLAATNEIPGRVRPIYDQGYQQLSNLSRQGAADQNNIYSQGFSQARSDIGAGYTGAQQGLENARSDIGAGYTGAGQQLDVARGDVQAGYNQAGQQMDAASAFYDPYSQTGLDAMGRMASQATNDDLLNRRMDRSSAQIRERLAAQGMGGSGYDALQESGAADNMLMQDMAAKAAINSQLAGYGYGAAQGQAGIGMQRGAYDVARGSDMAGFAAQQGAYDIAQGGALSGLSAQQGAYDLAQGSQYADLASRQAAAQGAISADLYSQLGQQQAGYLSDIAGLETTAGLNRANIYGTAGSGMANIQAGLGPAQAGVAQSAYGNLAALAQQGGADQAASQLAQSQAYQGAFQDIGKTFGDWYQTNQNQNRGGITGPDMAPGASPGSYS